MVLQVACNFEIQPQAVNDLTMEDGAIKLRPRWPNDPSLLMQSYSDSYFEPQSPLMGNGGVYKVWDIANGSLYGITNGVQIEQANYLFQQNVLKFMNAASGAALPTTFRQGDGFTYLCLVRFPNVSATGYNNILSYGADVNGLKLWRLWLDNQQIRFETYDSFGFSLGVATANCPSLANDTWYFIQFSYFTNRMRVQVRNAANGLEGQAEVTGLPGVMPANGGGYIYQDTGLVMGGMFDDTLAGGAVYKECCVGMLMEMVAYTRTALPLDFTVPTSTVEPFVTATGGNPSVIIKLDAGKHIDYDISTINANPGTGSYFATAIGSGGWEICYKGGGDLNKLLRMGWSDWLTLNQLQSSSYISNGRYLWLGLRLTRPAAKVSRYPLRWFNVNPVTVSPSAEPLDELISENVQTTLEEIKIANGYFTDVQEVIRIRQPGQVEPSVWPCIAHQLLEADVSDTPLENNMELITLIVEAWLKEAPEGDMDRALNRLKADICDSLQYDPTRGNNCFTTRYRRWRKWNTTAIAPHGALQLYFEIQVRHSRTDSTKRLCKA